ncbi:MAG: Crp/Fnr family transcriptional regulator [Aquabacterium sp.]|uniref:Crp/Fnr family transcriptional regulator n=1 Tax=Aquabacterium sp. TaxID=1872578 RepID=UPI0025BA1FA3|nr:Crp/Fnr family transcriptional regulator [Aquabacterium sp.]MBI3383743.1 Crp/Fnr family transcriptional regulator [Aquabacterium sp.]
MGSRRLNVVSYLGSQPLFKDMSAPELARIAAASTVRRLSRGEALFHAGQSCEGLYLVIDGLIKLFAKVPSGHEKVMEVIGAGGCVSESLMFSDGAHSVNASVLFDAQLLVVPKDVLVHEIEHNAGLAMRMLTGLSRRMNGLVKDIEAVTLHSGVKRVVDYLLHSPVVGEAHNTEQDVTVSLPASKGTIASLLSVTPEHFSRILHDLQANGLISVERRHIHILDAQRLASYA